MNQRLRGIIEHLARRARPDRAAHWQQIPVPERASVASGIEQFPERDVRDAVAARHGGRGAVKAHDVFQHAPEFRAYQIASLREYRRQAAARPFEVRVVDAHAERHVARGRIDAERLEQRDQVRVSAVVVHQKAGVDRRGYAIERDVDGMRVAAEIVVGLKERHVITLRKQPAGGKPGDARSDHCDTLWRHYPVIF